MRLKLPGLGAGGSKQEGLRHEPKLSLHHEVKLIRSSCQDSNFGYTGDSSLGLLLPLLLLLVITSLHSSSKPQKMCVCVPPTSVTSQEAVCKLIKSCGKMMELQYKMGTYTPHSCKFESKLELDVRGKRPPAFPWTEASLSHNDFRGDKKNLEENIYLPRARCPGCGVTPPPIVDQFSTGTSTVFKRQFGQCMSISLLGKSFLCTTSPPPHCGPP